MHERDFSVALRGRRPIRHTSGKARSRGCYELDKDWLAEAEIERRISIERPPESASSCGFLQSS